MSDFLPFIVVGLVSGSVYGLTATGLILTYKTAGIFNFGHGALAAAGAYLFFQMRQEWGWPWPVAAVLAVFVAGPLIGLVLERLAAGLAGTSTASKVVATVGLLTAVQGLLAAIYGPAALNFRSFLPTRVYSLGSVNVGLDQIIVFLIAGAATIALTLFLRLNRLGTAMRGVVDDADLLDLAGTDPVRVRRAAWAIGSSFASLSGLLLAPSIGLDPLLLTLLVVQAFGAAAIGGFSSLPLTYAGGLLIGVAAALSTKYVNDIPTLAGFPASLPFVVLFVVLVLTRRGRLVELGTAASRRVVTASRMPARARRAGAAVVLAVLALVPTFAGARLPVYTIALVYALVFASLRLLVTVSGQVSLCHVAFAAVGATSFAHLAGSVGVPWPLALVGAGLVAVPVGALVAIPAIRLSGLYLALATFGFGILLERLVYPMGMMFGGDGEAIAPRPDFGFLDGNGSKSFYYLVLAVVLLGLAMIAAVTRSRLGRLLRAMADSPLALSTLGTSVNATRVLVFCISAFLAGVAGGMLSSFYGTVSVGSFPSLLSLTLIVVLAISGSGELRVPVVAAVALYIVPSYIRSQTFNDYLPVLFGVSAIAVALASNPAFDLPGRVQAAAARSRRRAKATRLSIRAEAA